jgi:hypothetical protein
MKWQFNSKPGSWQQKTIMDLFYKKYFITLVFKGDSTTNHY